MSADTAPLWMHPKCTFSSALHGSHDPHFHADIPTSLQASDGQNQSDSLPHAFWGASVIGIMNVPATSLHGLPPFPSASTSPAHDLRTLPLYRCIASCDVASPPATLRRHYSSSRLRDSWVPVVLGSKLRSQNYLPQVVSDAITHLLTNIWWLSAAL